MEVADLQLCSFSSITSIGTRCPDSSIAAAAAAAAGNFAAAAVALLAQRPSRLQRRQSARVRLDHRRSKLAGSKIAVSGLGHHQCEIGDEFTL